MNSSIFSILFMACLTLALTCQFWLAMRQIRHVAQHEKAVPSPFTEKISLEAHQKAAQYTILKTKFSLVECCVSTIILLSLTFFGGLQVWATYLVERLDVGITYQMTLLISVPLMISLLNLPFDYYRQFVIEEKFGFNHMGPRLFWTDVMKQLLLSLLLGIPFSWVVLSLMQEMGQWWWLYVWICFVGFQFILLLIYPTFIAPLFNTFKPLEKETLKERINALLLRVGFSSKGIVVMDGSRRSGHGNAYFSGFGSGKRIVLFDTLLDRLTPSEIEAVLAHELGHFKSHHIAKRMVMMLVLSLVGLALLGYLKEQLWFYTGLGVMPLLLGEHNDAMALLLFGLALPVFTFFFSPIGSFLSRKHEFEADRFAASYAQSADLVSGLVKLYHDNATTLTPDPIYSAFYHTHPPALMRIEHLLNTPSTQ